MSRDRLFETLRALLRLHSPSGVEDEIDAHLMEALAPHGEPAAGRRREHHPVASRSRSAAASKVALLAHKDEIGGLVKRVEENGRLIAQTLGDAHPWIWGEGPVEVLGRHDTVTWGALVRRPARVRRVAAAKAARRHAGEVEGRLDRDEAEREALAAAGVTAVGSRIVPARWRKQAVRLGDDGEYVACHALDDKVAVAMLLELADRLDQPRRPVDLVFTTREEVGCQGSQFYARSTDAVAMVALEVVPVAKEYAIEPGPRPGADPRRLVRAARRGPVLGAGRRRRRGGHHGAPRRRQPLRVRRLDPASTPAASRAAPAWPRPPRTPTASRSPTSTRSTAACGFCATGWVRITPPGGVAQLVRAAES